MAKEKNYKKMLADFRDKKENYRNPACDTMKKKEWYDTVEAESKSVVCCVISGERDSFTIELWYAYDDGSKSPKVACRFNDIGEMQQLANYLIGQAKEAKQDRNEYFDSDIVRYDPKDERPDGGGEYWKSRGASSSDVSGFVASRAAGLRLLRMVRYVLGTDEPKTWLDYREFEPNWIQFKFSADEFDVEKLDQMARANGNVLTETIVRLCVKGKEG